MIEGLQSTEGLGPNVPFYTQLQGLSLRLGPVKSREPELLKCSGKHDIADVSFLGHY